MRKHSRFATVAGLAAALSLASSGCDKNAKQAAPETASKAAPEPPPEPHSFQNPKSGTCAKGPLARPIMENAQRRPARLLNRKKLRVTVWIAGTPDLFLQTYHRVYTAIVKLS